MLARRLWLALPLLVVVACGDDATAVPTPELRPEPSVGSGRAAQPPPDPRAAYLGRWEYANEEYVLQEVCLELSPDGAVLLSVRGDDRGPKMELTGRYELRPDDDGADLVVTPARIHTDRWIGPCRKRVELARDRDHYDVLGSRFEPGQATTLRLVRGGERLKVCGERRCIELSPAEPTGMAG